MKPKYIIIHSMCKEIEYYGALLPAIDFLKTVKLSAHNLIDSSGNNTQMIEPNKRASHAGESRWGEDKGLNSCSIGIELLIDNATNYDQFVAAIKKPDTFTQSHYNSCAIICAEYCELYELNPITDILTHEMVAGDHVRGVGLGKIDPGIGFDYVRLTHMVKALMQ